MALNAPVGGTFERELPDAGLMAARVVCVYDLGTHLDPLYPKNDKGYENWRHLVQIQFELDQQMTFHGEKKPMMATLRVTLSSSEKATLRKYVEGMYGKKFNDKDLEAAGGIDVEKLLGRPCTVTLQHSKDGKYANIVAIAPPLKGADTVSQFYPSRFFSLSSPDPDVWATMSEKTRAFIADSREVKDGQVKLPELAPKAGK
jgi:hypothetical protein